MKETKIGMIPEGWEVVRIRDACKKPEYGYTASATDEPVGPKFLRITDIQNGHVNWSEVPYCKCPNDIIEKYLLHEGDIVFARTGATTGKSYQIEQGHDAIFASYLIRVTSRQELIDFRYLYGIFNSLIYWKQLKQFNSSSTQGGVNAKSLSNIQIPLPPLSEQQKIAEILSKLDQNIQAFKEHKVRLQNLKKRLLNDLLSGERRLRGAEND